MDATKAEELVIVSPKEEKTEKAPPRVDVGGTSLVPPKLGTIPVIDTLKKVGPGIVTPVVPAAAVPKPKNAKPSVALPVAPKPKPPVDPHASLAARVAQMMGAESGAPPASIAHGSTNDLHTGYFHFMLYGEADTLKTTTAAQFMGPENTRIIVTRRAEQMIPLAGQDFKFIVVTDSDALKFALLYPEQVFGPEWAARPDRTLLIDDITEGVNVLVDDFIYYFDEKTQTYKQLKDPRQAYKKAGDLMHDLCKANMGKKQHVGLIAVQRGYDIDGTNEYVIEPDVPTKIATLLKTEFEYVFYMEPTIQGGKMLTRRRKIARQGTEKDPITKQLQTWTEITFAKNKLPIGLQGALADKEVKDLGFVWKKIKAALKGDTAELQRLSAPPVAGPAKRPVPGAPALKVGSTGVGASAAPSATQSPRPSAPAPVLPHTSAKGGAADMTKRG